MKITKVGHLVASLLLISCASRCGDDGDRSTFAAPSETKGAPPAEPSVLTIQQPIAVAPPKPIEPPRRNLIRASRGRCTSPCAVFFDAISNQAWEEIETSTFTWAFSDGATSDGYMAAHVFELPEGSAAETFEVALIVERDGILVARDEHSITVQPLGGRTLCVAESDFSGCPSNNAADHFTNVAAAWNAIQTNDRILFRRGDSFSPEFRLDSQVPGPVHVGAFGDSGAPRPAIAQIGGSWRVQSQWSVTDLDISGQGTLAETLIQLTGDHILVMRNHLHDAQGAYKADGDGYDFALYKFLINNVTTGIWSTSYLAGSYTALVGNQMEMVSAGTHHTVRIAGGKRVLVANNELINNGGFTALTVRGSGTRRPGSDYVLVQDNLLSGWTTVAPQNGSENEELQHILWQRNMHMPSVGETSIISGLEINGHDMVFRNNIFYQIRRAMNINSHSLAGQSRNIHVYHNTHFIDRDTGSTSWFCSANNAGSGIVVQNNLGELHSTSGDSRFISIDAEAALVNNNYGYMPGRTSYCETPDGDSTCTDPRLENTANLGSTSFLRPGANSLADDTAVDVPVTDDIQGTPRPQGGASDIGAVERVP